ncbi:immunoglobulin-like domain-containing protein [Aquimarina sp. 2201CG14-23]|uniref:immunoglobulin-like domain-containing protein n=1 Tax=Aquimarina mycalae TaxID=3040073 RepID=UPI002477EAB0|nr:immunoglobulin-like domain-containing protein [Aquimarina sp. 2201CG14-23]MDH7445904.1 DUF5011 domain-containing protein [Aquimarina sp. 2201CG14-23]
MKKFYQYIVGVVILLSLVIACNKEITEDLVVFFKVEFSETTLEAFLNTAKTSEFTITGGGEIGAGDYQVKYNVTEGSGSYVLNSVDVAEDQFVDLPAGPQFVIEYIGTTVGTNKVTITIRDQSEREEEFELTYNVNDTAFTFDVVPSSESTYVDGVVDLNLNITEISSATYNVQYVYGTPTVDVVGAGDITIADTPLNPETLTEVPVGDSTWQFKGTTLGTVEILFTATSSLGVSVQKMILLEVGDTPDFTFTALSRVSQGLTNNVVEIDFNLEETVGTAAYTMTYSTSNTGSFAYDGTTYSAGEVIPIVVGASVGEYIGTISGEHAINFTVVNDNSTPINREALVTLIYNDPDTQAPVISITGDNPQIIQLGESYTELGATVDDNSPLTIDTSNVNTAVAGSYTVIYSAEDSSGNVGTAERTVIVNAQPTAVINATPLSGIAPLSVSFNDSGSSDTDGTLETSIWNFGDNSSNVQGAFPFSTSHTYNSPGTYTASLNVVDNYGGVGIISVQINVTSPDTTPPVININGSNPTVIQLGGSYTEEGASAIDDVDGAVNVSRSGTVNTSVAGTYTITYTATDSSNNTAMATRTVIVNAPPTALINTSNTDGVAPFTVLFNNTNSTDSDGTIVSSVWDFGDGSVSESGGFPFGVSHTFNSGGLFTVTLQITDNRGGVASTTTRISVLVTTCPCANPCEPPPVCGCPSDGQQCN